MGFEFDLIRRLHDADHTGGRLRNRAGNRMTTLTIHDLDVSHGLDASVLAFDLRDLLRVLAPLSLKATWTIMHPDESNFWATGEGGLRLEKLAETSAQIGGDELLAIAENTVQVIWGDFIGALPDNPHSEWITVRAIDSSFYEVETTDQTSVAKIKLRFRDVRTTEGRN